MLKNKILVLKITILILILICIRLLENQLFYDPFLNYYKLNFQLLTIPKIDELKLFFGLLFRYLLNSIISILIIYLIFKDLESIKFISVLYILFFMILILLFFIILNFSEYPNKMILFYVRRFLIQPIFLLLFIPAFYFQKTIVKN